MKVFFFALPCITKKNLFPIQKHTNMCESIGVSKNSTKPLYNGIVEL